MADVKNRRIADYMPLIEAAQGLTLSQVCTISGLESSTIQNWIKRGFVPHPVQKKYRERHLARILLISELRQAMQIDRVGELLKYINGETDDESDDIISEERLYDIFREMTERIDEQQPSVSRIGELASQTAADCLSDMSDGDLPQIINALTVMAYAYSASCCMDKAEEIMNEYI